MLPPRLSDLFAKWNRLRGSKCAPFAAEASAAVLSSHIPDLLIADAGPDWRIRFAGSGICALFERELTGQPFCDLFRSEDRLEVGRLLDAIFNESGALGLGTSGRRDGYPALPVSLAILPLLGEGGIVTQLLIGLEATEHSGMSVAVSSLRLASIRMIDPDAVLTGGMTGAGLPPQSIALRRGHLVLLKSTEQGGNTVSRR